MSNAGAAIAAIRLRKERQIVEALRERGALSATSATQLSPPHGIGHGALRSLLRSGAVVEVGAASYYLNQDAYDAMRARRRVRIGIILLVVLAAAALSFFMGAPSP